jgi:hypothetical protein
MTYLLLVSNGHRWLWFGLAVSAAVIASLSIFQGLTLWIVGLICLVWSHPREKSTYRECSAWIGIGAVTTALYSVGYNFSATGCLPGACGVGPSLHHPVTTIRFFLALIGNVLPSGYLTAIFAEPTSFAFQEFIGALVLAAGVFVMVLSIRERRVTIRLPVPLVLITFALLFDSMLAVGRAGGPGAELGALFNNRYVMPNLLLLLGIVSYALAHIPAWPWAAAEAGSNRRRWLQWAALGLLSVFVVGQTIWATKFGIANGESSRGLLVGQARTVVNLQRQPASISNCEVDAIVFFNAALSKAETNKANRWIDELKRNQLSIFYPSYQTILRSEGGLPPFGCG